MCIRDSLISDGKTVKIFSAYIKQDETGFMTFNASIEFVAGNEVVTGYAVAKARGFILMSQARSLVAVWGWRGLHFASVARVAVGVLGKVCEEVLGRQGSLSQAEFAGVVT